MRKISTLLLAVLLLFIASPVRAQDDTIAKQAIIMDHDTGIVLLEKNADEHKIGRAHV